MGRVHTEKRSQSKSIYYHYLIIIIIVLVDTHTLTSVLITLTETHIFYIVLSVELLRVDIYADCKQVLPYRITYSGSQYKEDL